MKCRCGSQMRRQSQGVWFCVIWFCETGDRFAVTVNSIRSEDIAAQWYTREDYSEEQRIDNDAEVLEEITASRG